MSNLKVGDRVRFVAMSPDDFETMSNRLEHVRHYYPTLDRIETIRKALEIADALIAEGAK